MRLRLEQIAVSLALVLSLLIGTASACTCSHHAPEPEVVAETDCHLQHKQAEEGQAIEPSGDCIDESCICFVNQKIPLVVAKKAKDIKPVDTAIQAERVADRIEFCGIIASASSVPALSPGLSYSSTLRSLLPARAPPRL